MGNFTNLKIGKKLAVASIASVLQLTCVAGLSLWALSGSNRTAAKAENYAHKLDLSQKIEAKIAELALHISTLSTSEQVGQEVETILALRKGYAADFEYLELVRRQTKTWVCCKRF